MTVPRPAKPCIPQGLRPKQQQSKRGRLGMRSGKQIAWNDAYAVTQRRGCPGLARTPRKLTGRFCAQGRAAWC